MCAGEAVERWALTGAAVGGRGPAPGDDASVIGPAVGPAAPEPPAGRSCACSLAGSCSPSCPAAAAVVRATTGRLGRAGATRLPTYGARGDPGRSTGTGSAGEPSGPVGEVAADVRAAAPRRWTVPASGAIRSGARWTAVVGGAASGAPRPGRRGLVADDTDGAGGTAVATVGAEALDEAGERHGREAVEEVWTFVRWASGRSAPAAGGVHASTRVSDRDGTSAAAPGATTDSCRSGSTIVADGPAALDAPADDDAAEDADRWTGAAPAPDPPQRPPRPGAGPAGRRVPRSTSATRPRGPGAATSPDGASGVTSCPSWPTIGGSGRAPGTSARNDAAGATTGGSPLTRWIGGSDDHAPVGGASVGGAGETVASVVGSGSAGAASERPNGHGRRTVTPPQSVAC